MFFPRYFYGSHKDVKGRCQELVRNAASLDAYNACVLSMGFVDTAHTDGLFVLETVRPSRGKKMNFHIDLPLSMMNDDHRVDAALLDAIFHESLKTAWGTLLLTPFPHYWDWSDDGNRLAYIEAVFRHWDEIGPIGPRYALGSREGEELLALSTMIKPVLMMISGLSEEDWPRTNWTELFHAMKSEWERRTSPGALLLQGEAKNDG